MLRQRHRQRQMPTPLRCVVATSPIRTVTSSYAKTCASLSQSRKHADHEEPT